MFRTIPGTYSRVSGRYQAIRLGEVAANVSPCPDEHARQVADDFRYAFDVIGELYFGRMFGFLETGADHGSWIESLDLLMPFLCMTAVAPTYVRPLILMSALVVPGSLKALKAIDNIGVAARKCVAERFDSASKDDGPHRTDMVEQLHEIHLEKGEKVDFQIGDIQQEA